MSGAGMWVGLALSALALVVVIVAAVGAVRALAAAGGRPVVLREMSARDHRRLAAAVRRGEEVGPAQAGAAVAVATEMAGQSYLAAVNAGTCVLVVALAVLPFPVFSAPPWQGLWVAPALGVAAVGTGR